MTTTKQKLLDWLKENQHHWVSGEHISNQMGISRTAVWKQIKSLKEDGHQIESAPKKGYRLGTLADVLIPAEIRAGLRTRVMGRPQVITLDTTDSTNLQAKALASQGAHEGTVVVADTQTVGRGRRGRQWYSPPGRSIYASIILRPTMTPSQAPQITMMTAVAAARTLVQSTGLNARIKWPNDILINGRKIAGILTEMSMEMDLVDYVVVGLGINVNTRRSELPADIEETATSIRIETGRRHHRSALLCDLLMHFESSYEMIRTAGLPAIMTQWRDMTDIIGQRVHVDVLDTRHSGIVRTVDDDGVLILRDDDGNEHRIFSGDVTRVRPS